MRGRDRVRRHSCRLVEVFDCAGIARGDESPLYFRKLLSWLVMLALLVACRGGDISGELPLLALESQRSVAELEERPELFVVEQLRDGYLVGLRGRVYQASPLSPAPDEEASLEVSSGMDRIVAAAQSSHGEVALLDAGGNLLLRDVTGRPVRRLKIPLGSRAIGLTIVGERIYLLLKPGAADGAAVVAYSSSGEEIGRWGPIPDEAWLQANLAGGGIAACGDGSVYVTYGNSRSVLRLKEPGGGLVSSGESDPSFEVVSSWRLRWARLRTELLEDPTYLVSLGLEGSRAVALKCSESGVLLRQVAHPKGRGSVIEVWESEPKRLRGLVPLPAGALLDVSGPEIYLGVVDDAGVFRVDRAYVLREEDNQGG